MAKFHYAHAFVASKDQAYLFRVKFYPLRCVITLSAIVVAHTLCCTWVFKDVLGGLFSFPSVLNFLEGVLKSMLHPSM